MRASEQLQSQAETADFEQPAERADSRAATVEQRWLSMHCHMLQDLSWGLLFRVDADFSRARIEASWPRLVATRKGMLRKVLVCAERNRIFVEEPAAGDADAGSAAGQLRLYQPIAVGAERLVVVLEMADRSREERRTVANLLRWNSEWLKFALLTVLEAVKRDLMAMFCIAILALQQRGFKATATALVTELAGRFLLQRVSLGLRKGRRMEVAVLSHSARFKHESNLVQAIGAAMDEAGDQDRTIVYPPPDRDSTAITHAHRELAKRAGDGAVCTIPISEGGELVGALTLERDAEAPPAGAELQQIEQLLAVVAPTLWLRHEQEKGLPAKAGQSLRGFFGRLFGPAHIRLKLGVLALALLCAFSWFATGDWRVTADAVIEGSVQRTIAAPIDGYIASADARPGDVVESGQLIGALDDSDLRLERLKWSTLRQQMVSELREARAKNDRAEVSIAVIEASSSKATSASCWARR